jgi:BirA family biotin operon repressor/biotin-[acetyl-CoA-carboxylase] ligase
MNQNFEMLAGSLSTVGAQITHLETTSSTMDVAWQQAREGAPDGTIVVADHQAAGRGRHDRSWVSKQAQDILCSVVLRPRVSLAGELLMLAALAVTDVTDALGVDAGIKWPNDVQVKGLKLAGVIAESKTGPDPAVLPGADDSSGKVEDVDRITAVLGIGLNVNFDPSTEPDAAPESTSLSRELGRTVDRQNVFQELMRALESGYSAITSGDSIVPKWRNRLTTLGREVTIASGKPGDSIDLQGVAHDVDSIGRLIIRDENGRDWPVAAGEVTVRDIK